MRFNVTNKVGTSGDHKIIPRSTLTFKTRSERGNRGVRFVGTPEARRGGFCQIQHFPFISQNTPLPQTRWVLTSSLRRELNPIPNSVSLDKYNTIFAFIFVRSILCLKLNVSAVWCVRVQVKFAKYFFSCRRTTSNYSETRFHDSFVMNSQQSILETSVGKNSRISTLNR